MEEATEKKIQAYQKEQELLLAREKEKARNEGDILWQTIKDNSRSKQDELEVNQDGSDQVIFNDNILVDSSHHLFEMPSAESDLHEPVFDKDYVQQRRRSSVFTRDLFGESTPNLCYRRASHVPDECLVPHSLGKQSMEELPPFQRRSSFVPQHLHPLAAASTHKKDTNMTLPRSSWEGEAHQEDMFALDEDMDQKSRKTSTKYLDLFDEENELNGKQTNKQINIFKFVY